MTSLILSSGEYPDLILEDDQTQNISFEQLSQPLCRVTDILLLHNFSLKSSVLSDVWGGPMQLIVSLVG